MTREERAALIKAIDQRRRERLAAEKADLALRNAEIVRLRREEGLSSAAIGRLVGLTAPGVNAVLRPHGLVPRRGASYQIRDGRITVPTGIRSQIPPGTRFVCALTEDGIIYRGVER